MTTENKTKETEADVFGFIDAFVDSEQKKSDSLQLIGLMKKRSGFEPKMWGPTMIGFGSYHYKYASGHQGDAFLIGFSPRKAAISLYVTWQSPNNQDLLARLGKFKMSKACIYVKKLSDIDLSILEALCKQTLKHLKTHDQNPGTANY